MMRDQRMTDLDYEIVVSAENNAYLLWQCLLFHVACVEVQGARPCFVIHGDQPLLPGFEELRRIGARVIAAPNYRSGARLEYPPRNTPGTLVEVEHDREWTLLCDPDLLIVRALPSSAKQLCHDRRVSWDSCSYMVVADDIRDWLVAACRRRGVSPARVHGHLVGGGVPHFIHRDVKPDFARRWLEATDTLIDVGVETDNMRWVASMWGFAIAMWELDLPPALTTLAQTSYLGSRTERSTLGASVLHYTYGDELFDKRAYASDQAAPEVWKTAAAGTSLSAWLVAQIALARAWYAERGIDVTSPALYRWNGGGP
jgi:hypothetical protein